MTRRQYAIHLITTNWVDALGTAGVLVGFCLLCPFVTAAVFP